MMGTGQGPVLRDALHGNGVSWTGCHTFAASSTGGYYDIRLRGAARTWGEANGSLSATFFATATQYALMGQAGRADDGAMRPRRKTGGKIQGNRKPGSVRRTGAGAIPTEGTV